MPHANHEKPLRLQSDKLVLEELEDELMIYDPARHRAFCLNQSAAFVWKHADGNRTISEISALMGAHFCKPVNDEIVWHALNLLSKDSLLDPSSFSSAAFSGLTRRTFLQKFSAGAAAAVPLATVLLMMPTKAHAASFVRSDPHSKNGSPRNDHDRQYGNALWGIVKKWV